MSPNDQEIRKVSAPWREVIRRLRAILHLLWTRIRAILHLLWTDPALIALISAIIGAVLGAFIAWWLTLPPSTTEIEKLITDEAKLAVAHDLENYSHLFASDAWVIQVRNSAVWVRQSQIVDRLRDQRFTRIVHTPIQVSITGDGSSAFAETYTTFEKVQPDRMLGHGKEYWQFVRIEGKWKIVSFQFDLPE